VWIYFLTHLLGLSGSGFLGSSFFAGGFLSRSLLCRSLLKLEQLESAALLSVIAAPLREELKRIRGFCIWLDFKFGFVRKFLSSDKTTVTVENAC
jgi:hypothetical protein